MGEITVRKKPVVAKAMQFTRETYQNCQHFTKDRLSDLNIPKCIGCTAYTHLDTLEGTLMVTEGSYIIKDVEGEFWAIKESIFNKTYEII